MTISRQFEARSLFRFALEFSILFPLGLTFVHLLKLKLSEYSLVSLAIF
ncbi:hypothetical protein NIES2104_48120 [Leptolyngbya sp. NIES-2104]|nr:hypothetical protein NIES2104_48120 [Leptolyngbya sp. NIES-2104]